MKKTLYTLALTSMVVFLLFFFACSKSSSSDNGSNIDSNHIPAEVTVTANLQGRVLDENGVPVQGAAVSSGVETTTTDINGIFTFSKLSMSSRFGFVKVVKQGYFTGSRSIITDAGSFNYVSIQLIPRSSKGSFAAATGGAIVVTTGDTAAFPAAGVVNAATNASYTGNVNVFATYLDPTASDLYKYMPGDLRGIGLNGKETALQSFGMLAVEMEGDAGEKLQLAAGKEATLTWAIPASLQATAPATIPLWYFNDSSGRWIEEGSALRVGNNYVGQVGHFSFWNCDVPSSSVNFKVHIRDQQGNPMAYTYIQFQSTEYGTRGGYTDSAGFAQGLIPKGQTLVMQVVTECGNIIGGANVGPALSDQDLGTITVTLESGDMTLTLTGSVVDCSNSPVTNGFANIFLEGLNYRAAVTNGSFSMHIQRCFSAAAQAQITVGDYVSGQQGPGVAETVQGGLTDVGQLSACGNSTEEFVTVQFNGKTYSISSTAGNVSYSSGSISGSSSTAYTRFYLDQLSGTGVFTPYYFNYTDYGNNAVRLGAASDNTLKCTVTGYGDVNQFITGTLSGNVFDSVSSAIYPLTGSFKVKRTN